MRINIEAKELKVLLEKVLPQVDKKTKIPTLECILLEAHDGKLTATASNLTSHLSVSTDCINMTNGKMLIHNNDIKLITKLTGEIELSLVSEFEIIAKSGKKSISVKNNDTSSFPDLMQTINTEDIIDIANVKENEFTTAINKLIYFTSNNENNKMMQCFNLKIDKNRMESLDGHRIGLVDINYHLLSSYEFNSVLLLNSVTTILKKILSVKSNNELKISSLKRHIMLSGKDFIYLQREVEGMYFKVDQFLSHDYKLSMSVKTKELFDIVKFDIDMIDKDDKKPIILAYDKEKDSTYIYLNTGTYKAVDKLETISTSIDKNFVIAFNARYIQDVLKCIDDSEIEIKMDNPKAPIYIYATGETYVVLPVRLNDTDVLLAINNYINKAA